ncbi:hypothetical protein CROQUDRAFT_131622 [Cronartium quercuum f. sp. fusiforme G11]|uniref:Replication factor C C-terminal domain-containing protein n=1 Tax=Cronartium quercuum f. sp. fusiforme G11 TaxID=708437 RepID=A0A9P6TE09_9BASI|nr:hypothetical protein CROQUDRAFT_131622 [Cronartium quercuum f. sp. fusiforme G11]
MSYHVFLSKRVDRTILKITGQKVLLVAVDGAENLFDPLISLENECSFFIVLLEGVGRHCWRLLLLSDISNTALTCIVTQLVAKTEFTVQNKVAEVWKAIASLDTNVIITKSFEDAVGRFTRLISNHNEVKLIMCQGYSSVQVISQSYDPLLFDLLIPTYAKNVIAMTIGEANKKLTDGADKELQVLSTWLKFWKAMSMT